MVVTHPTLLSARPSSKTMSRFTFIFFICLVCLAACKKEEPSTGYNQEELVGIWEAQLGIFEMDTIHYDLTDNQNRCAYSVVEFDYSSGFQLSDLTACQLIWCGDLKGDAMTWQLESQSMIIKDKDRQATITIDSLTLDQMWISTEKGFQYLMIRK